MGRGRGASLVLARGRHTGDGAHGDPARAREVPGGDVGPAVGRRHTARCCSWACGGSEHWRKRVQLEAAPRADLAPPRQGVVAEAGPVHPLVLGHLVRVRRQRARVRAVRDVDRADLVLDHAVGHDRAVAEVRQDGVQVGHLEAELLAQPPTHRVLDRPRREPGVRSSCWSRRRARSSSTTPGGSRAAGRRRRGRSRRRRGGEACARGAPRS